MGSMSINIKEHAKHLCEKVQTLRSESNLLDLEVLCEDTKINVHKVVVAACSKFFKDQIKSNNVTTIKLEDYSLKVKKDAVSYIVDYIYKGEVEIPCAALQDVCQAAHCLGVYDLIDFLPAPAQPQPSVIRRATSTSPPVCVQASSTQIEETSCDVPSNNISSSSSSSSNSSNNVNNSSDLQISPSSRQDTPQTVPSSQVLNHQWPSSSISSNVNNEITHNNNHFITHPANSENNYQHQAGPGHGPGQSTSYNNAPPPPPTINASYPYKTFYSSNNYNQENNYNQHQPVVIHNESQEATIIDLDSNSHDGPEVIDPQPRGRLRIINQPGPMTSENIHDLKNQHHHQEHQSHQNTPPHHHLESHSSNSAFMQWPNLLSAPFDTPFEAENSSWYSQFNYNDEGGPSWTTPAPVAASSWPSNSGNGDSQSQPAWPSSTSENLGSGSTGGNTTPIPCNDPDEIITNVNINSTYNSKNNVQNDQGSNEKVKIRPPPPLLAKGTPPRNSVGKVANKRPELEVRKDLTLPTAPTAREDNVFQADEDLSDILEVDNDIQEGPGTNRTATSSDSGGKFQCVECSMMFDTEVQLRSHMRHAAHKPVEEETLLFCPICKTAVLRGLESLKVHLYKNHGIGEVFRCEDCNFETSVKTNYLKHLTTHSETPKKLRLCSKCGKAFKTRAGLRLHQMKHDGDGLSNCPYCDFKTPTKTTFVKHLAIKHKKDQNGEDLKMNFTCDQCSFQCVLKDLMKNHKLRKHTSKLEMKWKCNMCDYATVEKNALNKHIRFKHTHDRPFLCNICGFSTHTQSVMARHKRGHDKSKPHVCNTCGSAYADLKRLKDHAKSHSEAGESSYLPFNCDFCGFSSKRKDNLQAHVKRLHPEMNTAPSQKMKKSSIKLPKQTQSSYIVGHINEDGTIRPMTSATDVILN